MRKFIIAAFLMAVVFASNLASSQTLPDTTKKIRSMKPFRLHRDTMVKKPMKKDTTEKV